MNSFSFFRLRERFNFLIRFLCVSCLKLEFLPKFGWVICKWLSSFECHLGNKFPIVPQKLIATINFVFLLSQIH
jgi:hypothetical protein